MAACEVALAASDDGWLLRVDEALARLSWDRTWEEMHALVTHAAERRAGDGLARRRRGVPARSGPPRPVAG